MMSPLLMKNVSPNLSMALFFNFFFLSLFEIIFIIYKTRGFAVSSSFFRSPTSQIRGEKRPPSPPAKQDI